MAYLRSIFPGHFPAGGRRAAQPPQAVAAAPSLPGWAYHDARLQALERDLLFQPAWAAVGHESQIPRAGEFLTIDTGAERVLVVRDTDGAVHALRNNCPDSPHTLVTQRSGRFERDIECRLHGSAFSLRGRRSAGAGGADLGVLEFASVARLMFARPAAGATRRGEVRPPRDWFDPFPAAGLMALGPPAEIPVAADWKVVVEQWLEYSQPQAPMPPQDSIAWDAAPAGESGWSAGCYRRLVDCGAATAWRRQFSLPNQLIEIRPDGLSVVQALPAAPGHCVVRRMDYTVLPPAQAARAALYLAGRLAPYARRSMLQIAESVQRGMVDFGYEFTAGSGGPAVGWLRRRLALRIPALAPDRLPTWINSG
jgi:phenylpropionate dioxygenase-like ring-hydroxylating dioxygenase large terminal subunit